MVGFDADRADAAMRAVRGTGRGLLTVRVGQHENGDRARVVAGRRNRLRRLRRHLPAGQQPDSSG